jgi:hypothetical protein
MKNGLKVLKSTFWILKVLFNHKLRTFFEIHFFGKIKNERVPQRGFPKKK